MTSNEIQRRMKNTSRDLPYPILDRILTNYMDELKLGGYSHKWRVTVLDCATKGFLRVWEKEKKRLRIHKQTRIHWNNEIQIQETLWKNKLDTGQTPATKISHGSNPE